MHAGYLDYTILFKSQYPIEEKLKAAINLMSFSRWLAGNRNPDIEKMSVSYFLITSDPRSLQGRGLACFVHPKTHRLTDFVMYPNLMSTCVSVQCSMYLRTSIPVPIWTRS